jgi:DNA-binding CsgD family transcriptional regulator
MLGDGKSLREVALACDISVRTATEYRSQLKHRGPPDQTQFLF